MTFLPLNNIIIYKIYWVKKITFCLFNLKLFINFKWENITVENMKKIIKKSCVSIRLKYLCACLFNS